MNNFQVLCKQIIKRSVANTWEEARGEWGVIDMDDAEDEPETCLCGHYPIKDVFILRNTKNGLTTRVGSTCVNKFIQKNDSFTGYKRITKDDCKSVTPQLLAFAHKAGWITDNDFSFYTSILRRRKLTDKQLEWKKAINAKIINNVKEAKTI